MTRAIRWALSACIVCIVVVFPVVYYRMVYTHSKRLRVIEPGRVYRAGQMTAEGLTDAVRRLHLKTIINVQDDFPDPDLDLSFWDRGTVKESELCQQLHVRFVQLAPDLISRRAVPEHRPATIDQFLDVLDDPSVYPVLIHCKAGLHRTGVLSAIYRMEYQGWSTDEAYRELRAHGFGDWVSTCSNDYITQYVLSFQPHVRHGTPVAQPAATPAHNGLAGAEE
jgi:protein tyrosine/serine phosphatase